MQTNEQIMQRIADANLQLKHGFITRKEHSRLVLAARQDMAALITATLEKVLR